MGVSDIPGPGADQAGAGAEPQESQAQPAGAIVRRETQRERWWRLNMERSRAERRREHERRRRALKAGKDGRTASGRAR